MASQPKCLAGRPPKCATFPLLFSIALFLPLHHSVHENFLTWCSKAHQVRYKYLLSTFNFCRIKIKSYFYYYFFNGMEILLRSHDLILN
jgi:hypothetical protein